MRQRTTIPATSWSSRPSRVPPSRGPPAARVLVTSAGFPGSNPWRFDEGKGGTVDESTWLVQRFEEHRPRLRAVAYRMLGSASEADDAMQDAWLRLNRADTSAVENLPAWLTTVVAR